jgi:hypothetical protein
MVRFVDFSYIILPSIEKIFINNFGNLSLKTILINENENLSWEELKK